MNKHYLDIDYKNNCFFEYSKVEKEGFEQFTSATGKVSYRKLYKSGVFGQLQSVNLYDKEGQGKKLVLRLLLNGEIYLPAFPLFDTRGNVESRFAEPLISTLENLNLNENYRIFPWKMESETIKNRKGLPMTFYGVSIKKADLENLKVLDTPDAKILPKFIRRKKEEEYNAEKHFPDLDFVNELGSLKPTAVSLDNKRKFIISLLENNLNRLGYKESKDNIAPPTQTYNKAASTPTYTNAPVATVPLVEENYDDLPF